LKGLPFGRQAYQTMDSRLLTAGMTHHMTFYDP
jgi:hypothetical protein